jgi:hypothetical protein
VPAPFFRDHIWPVFERTRAIVYILPEHASAASFLRTLSALRPEQATPG